MAATTNAGEPTIDAPELLGWQSEPAAPEEQNVSAPASNPFDQQEKASLDDDGFGDFDDFVDQE